MDKTKDRTKITPTFALCVFTSVFGNAFIFGFNIASVNMPALMIQKYMRQILLERQGKWPPTVLLNGNTSIIEEWNTTISGNTAVTDEPWTSTSYSNDSRANSSMAEVMTDDIDPAVIELLWAITVAICVLFGMVGAFTSGKIAEKFGRKRGMIYISILMIIAGILGGITKTVNSFEVLILSRAFTGLHSGVGMSILPMYLAEISPKSIRGATGTFNQLFITVGILMANILGLREVFGTEDLWPLIFAFNVIPATFTLIVMPFCPESPRHLLITMKKTDEAISALRKIRGYNDVSIEIDEMHMENKESMTSRAMSFKQLLAAPELRMPLTIAIVLHVAQQWSGINAVMAYSSFIFRQASVGEDIISYVILCTGAINLGLTVVTVTLVERVGRRLLLLTSLGVMALSYVVLTIFLDLQFKDSLADHHTAFAWVCIIDMHIYVIGFALGAGPIAFLIVPEIFRQEARSTANSIAQSFNWTCNFILMLSFRFIQEALGGYTYIIFIVILTLAITFVYVFVPETKNRTFEEICGLMRSKRPGLMKKSGLLEDQELQPMRRRKH
ncbi:hypothetical protein ScPMuIL_008169 [Solemya velum]